MPYTLLLGITVGLSVLFFWMGRLVVRSNVGTDEQLTRYLNDNPESLLNESMALAPPPSFMERVLLPTGRAILQRLGSFTPGRNIEHLTKRLDTAGRPMHVLNFLGLTSIGAMVFALIGFGLFFVLLHQAALIGVLFALIFAIIGSYAPNLWLTLAIRSRQRAIVRALPDVLDLIVVSTEAGQSFDQSLKRVTDYWQNALTEELNRILAEMRLGRTRREALTSASERIQLTEMSNLISAITQADELGVSIGKVLRVQANQLRVVRRQRAEELAHQAAIKMLFPLVFMIFPAMLAVLLGPAIPLIMETFAHLGG